MAKNDVSSKNKIMYKHLAFLPSYVIPSQIMAVTMDQIRNCTTGTLSATPLGAATGGLSKDRTLAGTLVASSRSGGTDISEFFADPDNGKSTLIQNLASLPAVVRSYSENQGGEEQPQQTFAHEEPTTVNFEALEPTSGRKRWKMRHHKPIKKKLKAMKNGYIGS